MSATVVKMNKLLYLLFLSWIYLSLFDPCVYTRTAERSMLRCSVVRDIRRSPIVRSCVCPEPSRRLVVCTSVRAFRMTRSNDRSCGTSSKILAIGGHMVVNAAPRMDSVDGHVTQWCSAERNEEETIWPHYNEDPDPSAKN